MQDLGQLQSVLEWYSAAGDGAVVRCEVRHKLLDIGRGHGVDPGLVTEYGLVQGTCPKRFLHQVYCALLRAHTQQIVFDEWLYVGYLPFVEATPKVIKIKTLY